MSVRVVKACLMTAVCLGVVGVGSGDAFAGIFNRNKDCCPPPCCPPPCYGAAVGGPAAAVVAPAPAAQKVKVWEYVPTWVEEVVTVNKPTWQTVNYTAYKWECVPETCTKQVTCWKQVCETVMVEKCVTEKVPVQKQVPCYEKVPVWKTVTTYNKVWHTVQVTEMRTKTVSHRVHTTECVDRGPSLMDRLHAKCDPCYCPPHRSKEVCHTHKVCETVCCPVTVCKKVCEMVPCTKQVCCYENRICGYKTVCCWECVTRKVCVPCTRTRCVPECQTVTCTQWVKKCVPYTCTKQVCVCVPCQEKVKVCKMVCQEVWKDVCATNHGCHTGCWDNCCTGQYAKAKRSWGRKHSCCETACHGATAGCCH